MRDSSGFLSEKSHNPGSGKGKAMGSEVGGRTARANWVSPGTGHASTTRTLFRSMVGGQVVAPISPAIPVSLIAVDRRAVAVFVFVLGAGRHASESGCRRLVHGGVRYLAPGR